MEVVKHSPHPKPTIDIDKGTSYRPISFLSVIADTGEEPSSVHNSKHTQHTHATRVQNTTLYSDGITHSKQHRSKGVQPNGSPCANNHVALDMSKAFDTINIHILIRKLLQTKIQGTIIKFIANYIKWRPFTNTFLHLHAYIPPPRTRVQVMPYADDITITSTHTNTNAAKKYIQPYLHKVLA